MGRPGCVSDESLRGRCRMYTGRSCVYISDVNADLMYRCSSGCRRAAAKAYRMQIVDMYTAYTVVDVGS